MLRGHRRGVVTAHTPQIYRAAPTPRDWFRNEDLLGINELLDHIAAEQYKDEIIRRSHVGFVIDEKEEELNKLRDKWYKATEDIMRPPLEELPPFREVNHRIPLIDEKKIYRYHFPRCAEAIRTELLAKINRYVKAGWWRPATVTQAAPLLCVAKKDGKLRTVIDAQQRNANTLHDLTPFPDQDQIQMDVARAKYRSKIDLSDAYEQVRRFVHVYLDDIFVFSDTVEDHERHLGQVFDTLWKAKLFLSRKKCDLFSKSIDCLGHRIDDRGLHADIDKMSRIHNWRTPRSYNEVQKFLGLVNYLTHFLPDLSAYSSLLSDMVHNGGPFEWRALHDKCFESIKALACKVPILKPTDPRIPEPIWVICNTSTYGIGAVYGQGPDWQTCRPVGFMSKKFTSAQRAYRTYKQEALAILEALLKWEDKLLCRKIHIVTDHHTLKFIEGITHPSNRQIRWFEYLARFDKSIKYIPGHLNKVADCLSRYYEDEPPDKVVPEYNRAHTEAIRKNYGAAGSTRSVGDNAAGQGRG
ncbi:hypothetical protein NUW54_g1142 [Trametes sanguinea]|uniref:Uncharacterized protein n=1 Tax=Trametes sanguinea TaxID=158606 RepID=A0ACC1Q783_9APHY|nr:hypothetical protein NUW54_g1142 [Trametes sanguinea]